MNLFLRTQEQNILLVSLYWYKDLQFCTLSKIVSNLIFFSNNSLITETSGDCPNTQREGRKRKRKIDLSTTAHNKRQLQIEHTIDCEEDRLQYPDFSPPPYKPMVQAPNHVRPSQTQTMHSQLTKKYSFVSMDAIEDLILRLREKMGVDVVSTYCFPQLSYHGWDDRSSSFFKFTYQTREKRQSPKPFIDSPKLIIPYFNNSHWSLIVRFASPKGSSHKWEFLLVDSGNELGFGHGNQMDDVRAFTKLHLHPTTRMFSNRLHCDMSSNGSYIAEKMPVPKQTELECGARMAFHMYLATVAEDKNRFVELCNVLYSVEYLGAYCRKWLQVVLSYRWQTIHPGRLPLWFVRAMSQKRVVLYKPLLIETIVVTDNEEAKDYSANAESDTESSETSSQAMTTTSTSLSSSSGTCSIDQEEEEKHDLTQGNYRNINTSNSNNYTNTDNVFEHFRRPNGSSRFSDLRTKKRILCQSSNSQSYFATVEKQELAGIKERLYSLYIEFIKYGRVSIFYKDKKSILSSAGKQDFNKNFRNLYKTVQRLKDQHQRVCLPLKWKPCFQDDLLLNGKKCRQMQQHEDILEFEHRMMSLKVTHCEACHKYELQFESKKITRPAKKLCETCSKEKRDEQYFIENNYHPVWFEKNQDGSFKTDDQDQPIPRFHIPNELSNLSMAEKLLIRRMCPYIPLVHLKKGNIGMKGHCICFPQDISDVCNNLPRQRSQVIKYIRQIGKPDQTTPRVEILKVNRNKVLNALSWLKRHHIGYHDITIEPSNLNWIPEDEIEREIETHDIVFNSTLKTESKGNEIEAVSGVQQIEQNPDDYFPSFAVQPNERKYRPSEKEKNNIRAITEGSGDSNNATLLDFPPVDNLSPVR